MSVTNREKQMAEAEELLADGQQRRGFAKGLFFGQYLNDRLHPYPELAADLPARALVADLKKFCKEQIDAAKIDRDAEIPDHVVQGLGRLGVLGACLPKSVGGLEFSQTAYCQLMEVLGGHCGSTALFVNAHHSIGPRALVLFGTPEQQQKYLPKLCSGEWLSAFALTEPEAGSDAANVQTLAMPSPDGKGFILNGQKRWITNGGLASALTVMARTPVSNSNETKITAFIVTPDMPGFEVVEKRMGKCGVRGTATSRLAFRDMFVPKENVLGKVGKGLRIALTVLDFGRTTFGASCTGAAKFCVAKATEHANRRVQFGDKLGTFELVKDKLAYMAAGAFAMESVTYQTAALIDSGDDDYMLETAMLKVFSTEVLWRIINDTFQIYGGKAYFTDEPYERMLRDGRINQIGEGANDVLRVFSSLVGLREVGLELKGVLDALMSPIGNLGKIGGFASRRIGSMLSSPEVVVRSTELQDDATRLGRLVGQVGANVERLLRKYQEGVLDRQYQLARVSDSTTELYVSACVMNRLDQLVRDSHADEAEKVAALRLGRYYLKTAARRVHRNLADMWDNDDEDTNRVANMLLAEPAPSSVQNAGGHASHGPASHGHASGGHGANGGH